VIDDDLTLVPEPSALDEVQHSLFKPLGDWAAQAACADPAVEVDPTIFDAPESQDAQTFTRAELAARQHQAISFCRICPVRRECRQDAVDNELTGIRGGVLFAGTAGSMRQFDLIALADAGELTFAVGARGGRPPRAA
jgi:hypothetical protein